MEKLTAVITLLLALNCVAQNLKGDVGKLYVVLLNN